VPISPGISITSDQSIDSWLFLANGNVNVIDLTHVIIVTGETVRPLTIDDLVRCAELLGVLLSQEREFTPDPAVQRKGLKMILKKPETGTVFVYESHGVIRGMVVILFTISTALGDKVPILEDVVVAPDSRGKGAGETLVSYTVDYAINQGCRRITLHTDHNNEAAHTFYHKHGFTKSAMVVFRKLTGS
jgi:ribosomal protein S18 acetylase RimI-like enzyme